MTNWLGLGPFFYTLLRIAIVWLSFHSAGLLFTRSRFMKKNFNLMPAVVPGFLLYSAVALILSIFGIMTRTAISLLLIPGSLFGLLRVVRFFRERQFSYKRPPLFQLFLALVCIAVVISSLMFASIPNVQFDDPLIIYAVRPDLWLSSGSIHWLNETSFAGFPFMSELISIFPAALSSERLDQLSVLQVFQFSMLLASVLIGFRMLKIKKKMFFLTAICIIHISILTKVGSYAKTDVTCMFFVTIALASIARGILKRENNFDYTPFFALGLAFSSKLTSALFLIPFALYSVAYFRNRFSLKKLSYSLFALALIPVLFGIRTMAVTGSPTYPIFPVRRLLNDDYQMPPKPEEISRINDRDGDDSGFPILPIAKNIGIFFATMEGAFLLFLAGTLTVLLKRSKLSWLSLPIVIYSVFAMLIYWPPWWGAKYTIQMYPFLGLLGAYFIAEFWKKPAIFATPILLVSVLIPGFVIAPSTDASFQETLRLNVVNSFVSGNWDAGKYNFVGLHFQSPEVITHLWMNEMIPHGSTILSLHQEKRYFSDNKVIVAWRYPESLPLFQNNSLEEEIEILESIGVEYVTFYRNDPLPYELENDVILLDHIGTGMILEPVYIIQEFVICKFNPEGN